MFHITQCILVFTVFKLSLQAEDFDFAYLEGPPLKDFQGNLLKPGTTVEGSYVTFSISPKPNGSSVDANITCLPSYEGIIEVKSENPENGTNFTIFSAFALRLGKNYNQNTWKIF